MVASVLIQVDDKEYLNLVKGAKSIMNTQDRANALGYMVEQMTKSVFGDAKTFEAPTAGGKADIQQVPVKNMAAIAQTIGDVSTLGFLKELKEEAIDIEAKATERPIGTGAGRGIIKVGQATPGAGGNISNVDYLNRARVFITDILESSTLAGKAGKIKEVSKLFAGLNTSDPRFAANFREALSRIVTNQQLESSLQDIIDSNKSGFLSGPFATLIRKKTKNLTVQINAKGAGKNYRFFQTFINLPITSKDIDVALEKGRYSKGKQRYMSGTLKFFLTSAFEKTLIAETKNKLEKGALGLITGTVAGGKGGKRVTGLKFSGVTKGNPFELALLDKLDFTVVLPTGGSIPMPGGLGVVPLFVAIQKEIRKIKTQPKKRARQRGQFMSNVQLSAILQQRLAKTMPRYSQPQRPIPRYVTGRLARSFQIMANYRTNLIGFYNTPPAAGYVDELNENGWMLDEALVEPTIRVITQQLFGRRFRVLRTQ